MKFLAIVSLIVILIGIVLAQTDPICRLEPIPIGQCGDSFVGYTYSTIRNRCVNFAGRGCSITGNFFNSRNECEDLCKEFNSLREAPFTYFFDRAVERIQDIISSYTMIPL
ncbi:uncharacterized protein Dana_GF14658 [Drosophila ananassae]|uniref:BPTI/Kunitz inhibitor domain-containing protein n=1 Tax=Drosophila ananassae TaxID=7217 RepID=B3MP46_DROAN|nr:kunitz-type serine protease inhibitor homolog beta-bungarotoxin B6 chain [Drosophila ananassae]EDV31212.1 uncharacterized protein Dana_GF14658 [Drosophila ananassae]